MSGFNRGGGNRYGGGGAPPRATADQSPDVAALLKPPLVRFRYFATNQKTPRPDIVGKEAEDAARKLATLPASQLRRFYSAAFALKRQLELDSGKSIADDEIRTRLGSLKAQAAYTWKRGERAEPPYPDELVAFFTRHADAVQTREDFLRGFCRHFEAVIAFHKVFEIKKDADQ